MNNGLLVLGLESWVLGFLRGGFFPILVFYDFWQVRERACFQVFFE
jgi:hypothetical protein